MVDPCSDEDIRYAFIIGGNENFSIVMEGRGFTYWGSHYRGYNQYSVSVGLIGEFYLMEPGEDCHFYWLNFNFNSF